ncbi:MAG: hypothetical protein JO112_20095 [Planctomycetes bacterium]|nr:hypothetical protein [Planctomycetota bacterium]
MNSNNTTDDTNPPDGATSFRFGAAFLKPTEEAGHYGLFRPLVVVRNEGGKITREQLEKPVGPLAIYRRRTNGDKMPEAVGSLPVVIKTSDPLSGEPFELILVWRPDTGDTL